MADASVGDNQGAWYQDACIKLQRYLQKIQEATGCAHGEHSVYVCATYPQTQLVTGILRAAESESRPELELVGVDRFG